MGTSVAFGCPECGRKVRLKAHSSGRRARCSGCGTLVEVPFFPRQLGRRRRRRSRWRRRLTAGLVLAAGLGGPFAAWQWWRDSVRVERAGAMDRALAALGEAERGDDPAAALAAADEALALASRAGIDPPGGREALAARRDAIARADALRILDGMPSLPTDDAMAAARSLAPRLATDPALAELGDRAARVIAEASRRWVDRGLAVAEQAEAGGKPAEALEEAERLASGLDGLPIAAVGPQRDRIRAHAGRLIGAYGARVGPVERTRGPIDDPEADPEAGVAAALQGALLRRGYVVVPPESPLGDLGARSPYLLRASIVERRGPTYLQSPHQTTLIGIGLELDRGGATAWKDYFEARTRVPLPGLSAMEASRLLLGTQPSPEVERRFHRDAWDDLLSKLRLKLNALPAPSGAPPS